MTIKISNDGPVRVITFNHLSTSNPFSRDMQVAVTNAARTADEDDSVRAIVFTGGEGRLFSAGGDFNEVQQLRGGDDVDVWIDTFMSMYLTVLNISKPTLGAIDGHAIGIGFQVALMLDWRIMSDTAKIAMPELRHGLGGSVGGAILTALYGADSARETMLGALEFDAEEALRRHFVQQITPQMDLMKAAMECAHDRSLFPRAAYRASKFAINRSLDTILRETVETSKKVHREAFKQREMKSHFEDILSRGSRSRAPV